MVCVPNGHLPFYGCLSDPWDLRLDVSDGERIRGETVGWGPMTETQGRGGPYQWRPSRVRRTSSKVETKDEGQEEVGQYLSSL